jgi:hypothetical protein
MNYRDELRYPISILLCLPKAILGRNSAKSARPSVNVGGDLIHFWYIQESLEEVVYDPITKRRF